jgi:uncharacterized protein YbcC (UPF0753/DUF2309 family)
MISINGRTDFAEQSIAGSNDNDSIAPESHPHLVQTLDHIERIIPPLWPLQDCVAVNPFLGLADHPFMAARQLMTRVRDCDLLPELSYFRQRWKQGLLHEADLRVAYDQCSQQYPSWFRPFHFSQVVEILHGAQQRSMACERQVYTVAEIVDRHDRTHWVEQIIHDIGRHCAAYYDSGQASWSSPWKATTFYEAWRAAASRSHRMNLLGMRGFRQLVTQMPDSPARAIQEGLNELRIPHNRWRSFLLCQIFSVPGWASYAQYHNRQATTTGRSDQDLVGLLAARLAYDVALYRRHKSGDRLIELNKLCPTNERSDDDDATVSMHPSHYVLTRLVSQVAAETFFRRNLCRSLSVSPAASDQARRHLETVSSEHDREAETAENFVGELPVKKIRQDKELVEPASAKTSRSAAQLVFCIDVRSEILRRQLEQVAESIETFGFAGFFGMPFEYVSLGEKRGTAQCPALLQPTFRIQERVLGVSKQRERQVTAARRTKRRGRKLWKSFQASVASCFSYVESMGLFYGVKLVTDSLRITRPVANAEQDGIKHLHHAQLSPDIRDGSDDTLPLANRIELAENMLRNLGLTDQFARIVVLCGHASEVTNNPFKSGLDCGACGGHSGEPNARVAAALLNDSRVRSGLVERDILIPSDTWFLPAVHITTTDEVHFRDTNSLPSTHGDDLRQLEQWLTQASALSRTERACRWPDRSAKDMWGACRDWSEVRPEWGLAGNAAFVVAPRSRTIDSNLAGRVFLHEYDHRKDHDARVLELIMTAPMIVTSWINLQYFASAVDNRAFGSGNKLIHNVVGQIGVLEGNEGDLRAGLPWQSVHDGKTFQHEPLRLLVVIEAPRQKVQQILERHSQVRDLFENHWLSLVVIEGEQFHRWVCPEKWQLESPETHQTELNSAAKRLGTRQPQPQEMLA